MTKSKSYIERKARLPLNTRRILVPRHGIRITLRTIHDIQNLRQGAHQPIVYRIFLYIGSISNDTNHERNITRIISKSIA